ncbi:MAG: hypothetical protein U9Q68_02540 [Euryarchaeota archaeon]|nr:hypothetical protein [Euryarchaeota archaeon]
MEKGTKNTLALVCIAMVCAIAIPAIIADFASGDFITINTITRTTTLGDNASYQITIENIGDETGTFSLTAINTDNASIAVLSQTEIILDPGQSESVVLNVTDDLVAGPYCVLVNATSQTIGLTDEVETATAVVEEEEEW